MIKCCGTNSNPGERNTPREAGSRDITSQPSTRRWRRCSPHTSQSRTRRKLSTRSHGIHCHTTRHRCVWLRLHRMRRSQTAHGQNTNNSLGTSLRSVCFRESAAESLRLRTCLRIAMQVEECGMSICLSQVRRMFDKVKTRQRRWVL